MIRRSETTALLNISKRAEATGRLLDEHGVGAGHVEKRMYAPATQSYGRSGLTASTKSSKIPGVTGSSSATIMMAAFPPPPFGDYGVSDPCNLNTYFSQCAAPVSA